MTLTVCRWLTNARFHNNLLRKYAFSALLILLCDSPSMIASLEEHSPWAKAKGTPGLHHQAPEYIAWHIRTTDGETTHSYVPAVHKYVIQEQSSEVCPTYREAMNDALQLARNCSGSISIDADDELVYISSNRYPQAA